MIIRATIAMSMILVFIYGCGNSGDGSLRNTGGAEQIPSQPASDQGDSGRENALEDVVVEASEPDYMEMPRPGVISRYDRTVRKYARRYGFDWRLISAQIHTESRFRRQARSYRGALGLMQIMPGTARWLEGKAESKTPELRGVSQMLVNPEMNIHLGCYYDAMLFSRIKDAESRNDRHKMMFAAYNAGPGNLNRSRKKSGAPGIWKGIKPHLPEETRKYVPAIYGKYEIYRKWTVLRPY